MYLNLKKLGFITFSSITITLTLGNTAQVRSENVKGAGSTFAKPLYEQYSSEYEKLTGIKLDYEPIGSGAGIRKYISETVDVGATDISPSTAEKAQMKQGYIFVPTAGGAISVVVNLPGVKEVKISRKILPKIFTGEITNWKQVDAQLPNKPIKVVVRADGSGSTSIFTSHLSAISEDFKNKIGASKEPNWSFPVLKGKGNAGIADLVKRTEGAIGYVEDTYARKNEDKNFKSAKIQNKAGRYVEPSLGEANKAMQGITFNPDFTAKIEDPKDGYPIVGMTWLLVYPQYKNGQKAYEVRRMLKWMLTTGQRVNTQLEYTQVPVSVVQRVLKVIDQIK